MEAFKAHLADYDVSAEVIQAYAVTFYHNGEFILVKTDAERAEQAMEILRGCGATRVNPPARLVSASELLAALICSIRTMI